MRLRRDRKETRQRQAKERQSARGQRGAVEQLARLDARLGFAKGAARERKRLAKMLVEAGRNVEAKS